MSATDRSMEDHPEPGRYAIRLKGHLDARWTERLERLSLSHESDGTTILSGPAVDQATLYGLLRNTVDLNLPLVSVMGVDPKQANGLDINTDTDHTRRHTNEQQEFYPLGRAISSGGRALFRGPRAAPST